MFNYCPPQIQGVNYVDLCQSTEQSVNVLATCGLFLPKGEVFCYVWVA